MTDEKEWTPNQVLTYVKEMLEAIDRRYEQRFDAQEKAVIAALASAEKAKLVAERADEKWQDNANEWRGTISDRDKMYGRQTDITTLKERVDKIEGSNRGRRDLAGWIVAGTAIVVSIIIAIMREIFLVK